MTTPRLRIVRSRGRGPVYEGMDRARLGSCAKRPQPLVLRGLALEDLAPNEVSAPWRALLLEFDGFERYELIALGVVAGSDWEELGFDVGETTPRAWSALAHRAELLAPEEVQSWDRLVNPHGLFEDRQTAERFLARYRACDDPDGGWTESGWDEDPSFYDTVPISRLRRADPMPRSLKKTLVHATVTDYRSEADWHPTITAITAGLAAHLNQPIEIDPAPVFNDNGFSMWLFADWAQDTTPATVWSGVLSGRFLDKGGLAVGFCQFIFDSRHKTRVQTPSGDFIYHFLDAEGDDLRWRNGGWQADDYGEWEDVPFPVE